MKTAPQDIAGNSTSSKICDNNFPCFSYGNIDNSKLTNSKKRTIIAIEYELEFFVKQTYKGDKMAMIKKTLITHTYPKPFNIYVDRMFLTDNKSKKFTGLKR